MYSVSEYNLSKNILLPVLLLSAASLYAPITSASPIYKVVDEQTGQVTFTDRPQNYEQQSENRITQMGITTGNDSSSSNRNDSADATPTSPTSIVDTVMPKVAQINYRLVMVEPSQERAYHRPAQSITVAVQVKPALQTGDSVHIYLDGNEIAQGLSTSISTVDILPGPHSIQVFVQDEKGQILQGIERTVYVIQNTKVLQNKKKRAEQLLAYQRLPWHQKVILKLRQNDTSKP